MEKQDGRSGAPEHLRVVEKEKGPARQEKKEQETAVRSFEYRDRAGKYLGKAVVEMSKDEATIGHGDRSMRVVRLVSLKLQGFKGGRPTSVDVMEMANGVGVNVFVPAPGETRERRFFSQDANAVVSSLPEQPVALGTLLHELGHANQYQDERFRSLDAAATAARGTVAEKGHDWDKLGPAVRQMAEKVPEVAKAFHLTPEVLADIDHLNSEMTSLTSELADKTRMVEASETIGEASVVESSRAGKEVAARKLAEAKERFEKMCLLYRVKPAAYAAVQILERDATRRAFEWMRELRRESGVDVLAEIRVKEQKPRDDCEASLAAESVSGQGVVPEWTAMDYVTHAKSKLESYDADKWRIGEEEDRPGVTPVPGRNRLPERSEPDYLKAVRQQAHPESAAIPVAVSNRPDDKPRTGLMAKLRQLFK
jgi:hypothetical protein